MTDVQAAMYDRKTAARPFDTISDILRSLSLVQSLLKARNSPNWRERAPTHMNLSVTEGLRTGKLFTGNYYYMNRGNLHHFKNIESFNDSAGDLSKFRKLVLLLMIV